MIKNKFQSKEFISIKNLNTIITSQLFNTVYDLFNIVSFLSKTNHITHYGIRENKPSGLFTYAVDRTDVIKTIAENYAGKQFYICESMYFNDKDNMLIQGDFYLSEDFILSCGYSDVLGQSLRESSKKFPYQFNNIDLKSNNQSNKLNKNIQYIIDYLIINNLFNMIIELTLYNCKVGINKENILIWEVRNY